MNGAKVERTAITEPWGKAAKLMARVDRGIGLKMVRCRAA